MAITAYGIPLTPVTSFKYLGRLLLAEDGGFPEVVRNIWRACQKWERLTRVLSRYGADARTLGQIYLEVLQSFMLYGSDIWVMTLHIERVLVGFHHRAACRLMGGQFWRGRYGVWVYPPLEDAMAEAIFQEVDTYIYHHQNTVAHYIATRPIMDLCLVAEQCPGTRVYKRWWEQEGLYLEGMRTVAWKEGKEEREGE